MIAESSSQFLSYQQNAWVLQFFLRFFDLCDCRKVLRGGYSCRSILQTPSWYAQVEKELQAMPDERIQVVDLYTLLWLVRESKLIGRTTSTGGTLKRGKSARRQRRATG
jgi:hypothetical protein